MKKSIILIVLFGFFMMPNTAFACGNSNSGSCTMEMSSKTNKKDCCQKDSHSKSKSTTIAMENGKALCSAPSVNTAIPHYNQFEIKSSNFNFHLKTKVLSTVSFTAGYAAIWLIPKIS
jgi:hypothetical protein